MNIDFDKLGGLIPAVVQDAHTKNVLMVGFMNKEALDVTLETKKVTFWSRTRNKLWTKGEESGHFLDLVSLEVDCDRDTVLVHAVPNGPVCHTGSATCFCDDNSLGISFLSHLQDFIDRRREEMPEGSYTTSLFKAGVNRMAQKVGEEALETALEAANGTPGRMIYEASDMLYHLIVLLSSKGLRIEDVVADLESRHGKTKEQYNKHQK
ncbi:MAG: bifunctional phosphoribosyl-AMP cyclohydrolase/phosphoribosyl-ATP diphosphatase HisIE [Bacteroidales bacterium]|nr:bifunctional phosphoribosyl-AMP cyclohydrolase/phosphoribosyl-ATP diphosphatase HisIE [Bacteroidales bacterium]